jgi:hypothetical protein
MAARRATFGAEVSGTPTGESTDALDSPPQIRKADGV